MASITAFRQQYMSSGNDSALEFASPEGRRLRYDLLWALYESSAYDDVHLWAQSFKATYSMYRYTRSLYNPAFRIGNFWSTHLMGGSLDMEAGDGTLRPTCLPIIIPADNPMADRLRASIGVLWDWSNWQAQKDLWTLWGTVLGDSFLQPIDDVARGKVYISTLHPSIVRDLVLDDFGNVKEYTIEYSREDPDSPTRSVDYVETCEHGEGTDIVFKTYKNNQEYAWDGRPSTWVEPYGFVPLVHNRHINVGKTWAWAEIYGALSKVRESDDIASKLSDHIRKSVDPAWLFNFSKPRKAGNQQLTTSEETLQRPHPGREEVPAIYASDTNAKGQALIGELNYQGVMLHLSGLVQQIERDYPELRFDNLRMEGSISGQALRTARQPATAKVQQRRAGYDKSLVRAQQMAIAIGGMRSYPEFADFNLDSYSAGALDHFIGTHPVFELDDFEAAEQEDMFWRTVQSARRAGADIKGYLQTKGWSDEKIELVMTPEALAGEPLPDEKAAIENARASRENRAKASGAIADAQDDKE